MILVHQVVRHDQLVPERRKKWGERGDARTHLTTVNNSRKFAYGLSNFTGWSGRSNSSLWSLE